MIKLPLYRPIESAQCLINATCASETSPSLMLLCAVHSRRLDLRGLTACLDPLVSYDICVPLAPPFDRFIAIRVNHSQILHPPPNIPS